MSSTPLDEEIALSNRRRNCRHGRWPLASASKHPAHVTFCSRGGQHQGGLWAVGNPILRDRFSAAARSYRSAEPTSRRLPCASRKRPQLRLRVSPVFRRTSSIGPLVVLLLMATAGCGPASEGPVTTHGDTHSAAAAGEGVTTDQEPPPEAATALPFAASSPPERREAPHVIKREVHLPGTRPILKQERPQTTTSPDDSGVEGTVWGPACLPQGCGLPSPPLAATIEVRSNHTGAIVATGRSAESGEFRMSLPPGEYSVRAFPDEEGYRCEEAGVRVEKAHYTEAPMHCTETSGSQS